MPRSLERRIASLEAACSGDDAPCDHGLEHLFPSLAGCTMSRSAFQAMFNAALANIAGTARRIPEVNGAARSIHGELQ